MANLAAAGVMVVDTWVVREKSPSAPALTSRTVEATLSNMGSATNNIPASALGFRVLRSVSEIGLSDNTKVYPAVVSADGTLVLCGGGASNVPQDITGTARFTVTGYLTTN